MAKLSTGQRLIRFITAVILFAAVSPRLTTAQSAADQAPRVAIVVKDATGRVPRMSLDKIEQTVVEPLTQAKCRIEPDEEGADVVCDVIFASEPPILRKNADYDLYISICFWDVHSGKLLATRVLGISGSSQFDQLSDMVHSELIAPSNGLQRELKEIRITGTKEPAVSLRDNARGWIVPSRKDPEGLVYIKWSGGPFEAASLENRLLNAVIDAGWQPCRSEERANALISGVVAKKERKAKYSVNGVGPGSELTVYDMTATLTVGSRSQSKPAAQWKFESSTPSSFSSMGGAGGAALKILREAFESKLRSAIGPALTSTKKEQNEETPKPESKPEPAPAKPVIPKATEKDVETLATGKLRLAKTLLDSNKPAARKRLKEIIENFKGTAAAKEAEELLQAP